MKSILFNDFVKRYEEYINEKSKTDFFYVDRALLNLFKLAKKDLDGIEITDRFHKDFRQIDMVKSRELNDAIWSLLNEAKLFFILYEAEKNDR